MKKLILITIMALAIATQVFGFAGHITQNTTWSEDVIVTGDTWIDVGVTLTIMPGVTVSFPKIDQNQDDIGDTDFIIEGRLLCQGMPNNKVYFISLEDNPQPSDWAGFDYQTPESGELSIISNSEILYAHEAFHINGRNVTFNGCRTAYSGAYGMRIQSTIFTTTINNSIIEENDTYGLLIENGTVNISDLTIFSNDGYGIKALDNVILGADDLSVSSNGEEGIWLYCSPDSTMQATFTDSRSVSNGFNGVFVQNSTPSFDNCLIANNGWAGVFVIESNANLEFDNCTVRDNDNTGFIFYNCTGTVTYSIIKQNDGPGIRLIDATPTFNYNNIYNNIGNNEFIGNMSYFENENHQKNFGGNDWRCNGEETVNHPESMFPGRIYIDNLTYKKDGDNHYSSGYHHYRNDTKIFANTHTYLNDQYVWVGSYNHNMPETTVSGEINEWIYQNSDISLSLYNTENCPNARAWVTQYTFCPWGPAGYQILVLNEAGTNVDFQHNWWNQITGVDTLIFQENSGITSYEIIETEPVPNAGANLSNIPPELSISEPSEMLLNPEDVTISWSDLDVDNDALISLYYGVGTDTTGTLIISGISEDNETDSYTWDLTDVPFGTYHIYGEITDGINEQVVSYAPSEVLVGPLTVKAPMNGSGVAGTETTIPLEVINAIEYYQIQSFQFTLSYNPTILEATEVSTSGTLSNGWSVNSNTSVPGQISVNGFSSNPLVGTGPMINIVFQVDPEAANYATSPLNFADFTFNEGDPAPVTEDGQFTVVNQYNISGNVEYYFTGTAMEGVELNLTGDNVLTELTSDTGVYEFPEVLAGDYTVTPSFNDSIPMMIITPYDASLTAQFSLSLHAFTTDQQIAADVTGNGSATAYDASFMAQYSVGLIDTFAAGRWSFNPTSITYDLTSNFGSQNYLGICIGDPSGNWSPESTRKSTNSNYFTSGSEIPQNYEGKISIPISFDNEFYSVVAKLSYDNTMIQFEDITQNSILNDFEIYTNDTGNNVYFGGFGLESISSPQDLFAINFITKTPLTSYRAITIDYILFDETVGGTARFETEGNIIPEKFVNSLIQNYPNPFSSETQIEFSISKETNVTIEVFNIKGQKVKTVVEENLDSGRYTRNLIMGELQSGIYFYKMVTDKGFSQIRKLILIK